MGASRDEYVFKILPVVSSAEDSVKPLVDSPGLTAVLPVQALAPDEGPAMYG